MKLNIHTVCYTRASNIAAEQPHHYWSSGYNTSLYATVYRKITPNVASIKKIIIIINFFCFALSRQHLDFEFPSVIVIA